MGHILLQGIDDCDTYNMEVLVNIQVGHGNQDYSNVVNINYRAIFLHQ